MFGKYTHVSFDKLDKTKGIDMISKLFLNHPRSVDETFGQHFLFATRFSMTLFVAAFAALLHAFIPAACEKTASTIIKKLYARIHNRGS